MITATAGTIHQELLSGWGTGTADALGYTILDLETGAVVQARRSNAEQAGAFREQPAGSGTMLLSIAMPAPGLYQIIVDNGAATQVSAELRATVAAAAPPPTTSDVRPDAALVRQILPGVNWPQRGYPVPAEGDPDPLQFMVDLAADWVEDVIGRRLDASLPAPMVRVAQMAVALATVSMQSDLNDEQLEAIAGGDSLASFSADGYSETYRDTGVSLKAQREAWMVHPWASLNRLLWMLMTPEKRAYWVGFLQGGGIPMWGVAEVDWSGQNRISGGYAGEPGAGGLGGDLLPMSASGPYSDVPSISIGSDGALG